MNKNDPTTVNISKSTLENRLRLHSWRRRKVLILLLVLVIGGLVTGLYIKDRVSKDKVPIDQSLARNYSFDDNRGDKLTAKHVLKGSKPGTTMKFNRPWADFLYSDTPLIEEDQRFRNKDFTDEGNNIELGQRIVTPDLIVSHQAVLAAKIVPPEEQSKFNNYDYIKDLLTKLSFNTSEDPSKLGLVLTHPTKFTNNSIKSGGQMFVMSATLPNDIESGVINSMVGELIEVKGKNANYYLLIAAIPKNWDSSPKTWQAIKDSIEVDQ